MDSRGLVVSRFAVPEAGAGTVGVHEAGNQDGEEEDAEDGFDDRQRAGVGGDGSDAGSTKRGDCAEAVVDEVEAVGDGVEVGVWVEVKGTGVDNGNEMEKAGEAESDEEVNAERSEDGFRIGVIARENPLQHHAHDEYIETKAEGDVAHREDAGIGGFEKPDALGHRGRAEQYGEDQERAPIADSVNTEEDDAAAHYAEHVDAEGAVVSEGVEEKRGEKKDEEEHVAAARWRGRRRGDGDRMFERGWVGH